MLERITKNIDQLVVRFPSGMHEVNCYLVKGKHGYTVIDTGTCSQEAKDIWRKVFASGISVEKVVLTHTHEDHLGLAKWFQQEFKIPIYVSDLGYKEMEKHREIGRRGRVDQLVKKHGGPGAPGNMEDDLFIYDFEPDGFFGNHHTVQLGNDFYEAIWTPGHAPDHFCFYNQEQQVMIIGDHVLKEISPVIGMWSGEETNPLREYFDSLEIMKDYPTSLALPGHGGIIDDLNQRVEGLKNRHHYRLQQVLQCIEQKGKTANQICHEMYGMTTVILFLSSFMATLTRLVYLESVGKVQRTEVNGETQFRAIHTHR